MSQRRQIRQEPVREGPLDWRIVAFGLCAIATAAALILGALNRSGPPSSESLAVNRPDVVHDNGYVSSETCQACHPREYASWHRSFHRTMTQRARPDTIVANFDNQTVSLPSDHTVQLERRGDEFFATFDDPDSRSQRRISRPIVMVTGSHEQQQYWYATGRDRLVSKLPAAYLISEQRWIARQAVFLRPPGGLGSDTGAWNAICIACHTTGGKPRINAPFGSRPVNQLRFDSQVDEFGISCEACHGPGDAHVRRNHNPLRRYALHLTGQHDSSIVNPRQLSPQRSPEVCGQCHSVWEFYDLAGERQANTEGLPYRPGDELRATRFIAQPPTNLDSPTMKAILDDDPRFLLDSFWPDGMIRVSGREYNGLIESPCYKNARDSEHTLTCFSCHTLHKSDDDRRSLAEWANTHQLSHTSNDGNEACLQCHPTFRQNLANHTKHQGRNANNCYNCHMPYTSYGLLRSLRSHQISTPNVEASSRSGRPNACNLCHLDKTLEWTSEQLHAWFGTAEVPLTDDERTVSASLLWLLQGDAGQRALLAWTMSWPPALEASGRTWIAPFLAQLLDDPYDAVRLIAGRSLQQLPGYGSFPYDFAAPDETRRDSVTRAIDLWRANVPDVERRLPSSLLAGANGAFASEAVRRLMKQQNTRPVALRE